MIPPTSIDGTDITGATIDGTDVQEITVDGDVVFTAVPESLVSRWTLDDADTSGSTCIDTVGNNDGTISGATTGVSGANQTYTTNEAYDFDGVNDVVDIPDNPTLTFSDGTNDEPFSIAAWINPDDATTFRIFTKNLNNTNREYLFTITGADNLALALFDGDNNPANQNRRFGDTDFTTLQNTWSHVVVTYDGSSTATGISLYIDAVEETYSLTSTGSSYNAMNDVAGAVEIGRFVDGSFANGAIDDVRVYSKELNSTEVNNLYNNGQI